jgi:preprotein translocase subunit SecG
MTTAFFVLTFLFILVSVVMILIILAQRSQGGGLAGAFGGAGGGTDTVFGGRVGDALTWATVVAFALYLLLAVSLNKVESNPRAVQTAQPEAVEAAPGMPAGPEGLAEEPAGTTPPADVPEGTFQGNLPMQGEGGDESGEQ